MKDSSLNARKRLFFFGCVLVTTILMGAYGFYLIDGPAHPSTLVYRSVQLFNLESGAVAGEVPLPLELARWLAPLSLAGGLIVAALTYFKGHFDRWRACRLRGHHIICGLGGKGSALAADLLSKGLKVVALDPQPAADDLERFRKMGGLHFPITAAESNEWNNVGVRRAATFTAVTPIDACNLAMAMKVERVCASASRVSGGFSTLRIFAHIGSVSYRDLLDRNSFLGTVPHRNCTIRSFNIHANLARVLFRRFPLETAGYSDGAVNITRSVHLIVPSIGNEAMALLIHSARIGHYLGGRKVHFHVIAPSATTGIKALRTAYPSIDQCCSGLEAIDTDGDDDFGCRAASVIQAHPGSCFTVFPCVNDSPVNLADILRVHEEVPAEYPFRMPVPAGLRDLLEPVANQKSLLSSRIEWIPGISAFCGEESVFNGRLDQIALSIHENWREETERQIRDATSDGELSRVRLLREKPIFKPWDACTEEQKDSSRSQADHLMLKIRAAKLDPSIVSSTQWLDWCIGNPESLELLARVEHERWAAHLWLAGWTSGLKRDDSKKIHNNLIPYDELDEATQEYDKCACRHLANYVSEIHELATLGAGPDK